MTRCYDANLVQIPVEVETPDHHYYHVSGVQLLMLMCEKSKSAIC
jgi:hypothetical protein